MSPIQELPSELQLRVAELCPLPTLSSLVATSKAFHQLLTPVLYREVDLSSHNGPDIPLRTESFKVPSDWPDTRRNNKLIDDIMYDKQRAFIRTLRSHLSLGKHVKVLRWTTVDCSDHAIMNKISPIYSRCNEGTISPRELRAAMEEYDFNGYNSRLWDTFVALPHVLEVDIAFLNERREACPPPPLFQQVQSLRLSGIASSFLIRSILKSANPGSVKHLHLNNLNQFAELEGIPDELTLREKGKIRPFPRPTGSAGPMRTHLSECSSRWSNLQSLIIDTVGFAGLPDRDDASVETLETEDARYRELAALVRSVAKTLRVFRFQQGPTEDRYKNGWRHPPHVRGAALRPPQDGLRPMDALFIKHILSSILESKWPRLEKIELFGVASHTSYPNRQAPWVNSPLSDKTLLEIRTAVGPNTVLDIRTDATRVFWRTDEKDSGVPGLDEEDWSDDED
ncbi:uncharacterized protein F4807DRAFT_393000 [Annulohypoxylon truncatum]|uniref:uncharacterized protein n=1 Tax=Annulohypoxylon truncatum TaxID=327061 RepID=UPI0020086371|nr:uncharacterized protein F4807DRAFT_393000 [Annulohypoxylon truncatum]KAI1211543.1 hypothetical protein F4807DRAFT_393000 [Annulohypoxylon truncatum]